MKRNLAQRLKDTSEVDVQAKSVCTDISDVGNKLLKGIDLTLHDINVLGQRIAEQQEYDKNQLIVCNVTELNERLELVKNYDIAEKPLFIICQSVRNTKVALCITKLFNKTICLYKDFLDVQVSEELNNILEQYFGKGIDLKIHSVIEKIEDQRNQDILSLKTVETMMVNLKPKNKKDFIEGFANTKKTFFEWLKNGASDLKEEIFSLVKEGYYKTMASDVNQLSEDEEFKKAIKELINSIPLVEVDNFKIYQTLLKEFVEIEENEVNVDAAKIKELENKLNQARGKVFEFGKTLELKLKTFQDENYVQQLDIVKKFPAQMEKFTKIFEPLIKSKIDKNFEETLNEICFKLDLEYDKLRSFFKAQEETIQEDNYNAFNVGNIDDVIKALPKLKSEDDNVWNSSLPTPEDKITDKTFDQLLSEVIVESSNVLNLKILENGYYKIKNCYKLWNSKEALEINQWAISKKGQLADSEVYEAIAVMDRANQLVTGEHRLRDTQILAVLTFLLQKGKGQISQIHTGEGKTTIVSVLAAIMALKGKNVDIVTSNPVLASDGIKDKKLFYDLLSLSATTNNLDENYKSGPRECYKADIVYGSIGNFQFDFLKDSFLGLNTRADRAFETIILDEVDSMIIDNASHIAKLSGPLPGMESLKYVYIKIWQALYKAEIKVVEEFREKLKLKAQELQKLSEGEEAELDSIQAQMIYEQFQDELQNSITERIRDIIKSSNPTKIDIIPSHIQAYADSSLNRWIDSAIDAQFKYNEDEQYVIRCKNGEEVIQPVDYANTGITLKNTIWQYGLHQFLQLKHNLHLTSESLTSCFISNCGYINKYGDQIFGLTGTLGSEAEQELLSSIYNVGYAKIPTYREKKFVEIIGEVVDDKLFYAKVAASVISEVNNGRAALIICETRKDAKEIQEVLKKKNISLKIFFDEENAHVTDEEIIPGEVVIATNIAGRGTDFKTTAILESNKGLHVCVAFLPCNKRVEDQAFGRTSRQGNQGTAQLIIRKSELEKLGIDSHCFEDIKYMRDQIEKERIQQIKEIRILELKFQDELFARFSSLYRKLQKQFISKGEYKYVLEDLKEYWAFWLEKKSFKGSELADKSVEEEFGKFEVETCETMEGKIKFNPYYSIQQAEYFISSHEKFDEAEKALNHAISISKNPEILHSAYIKLFELSIEKGGGFLGKAKKAIGDVFLISVIKPDRQYKKDAKEYLTKAKAAFKKELDYIENLLDSEEFADIIKSDCKNEDINNTSLNEPQKTENLFIKHLISKQLALNLNINHADSMVQQIDEHKDESEISIGSRISDYFSNLKPENEQEIKMKKIIHNSELAELAALGTNTVYSLRELVDVCPEIAKGAQIQIGGGIALIVTGMCFPPALPVTSSIGGTMITEGICDIAFELINQNSDGKFNSQAYVKGKVISYGISLLTMGINAALQCPKILRAAKNACRWLSEALRRCPRLKKACEFLATKIDKLGNWFEKMETIAKFSKLSKAEKLKYVDDLTKSKDLKHLKYLEDNIKQIPELMRELQEVGRLKELTHFEKCVSTLNLVAINTVKNVGKRAVENIIMSKIVTPAVSSLMSELKPTIKNYVGKSVRENIDREKLKSVSYEDIQNAIEEVKESIDYETVRDIFKDAILGITKHCNNWRVQLGALAIDKYISWKQVYNYVKNLCIKINNKLKLCTGESTNQNIEDLINQLIKQLSEEMYSMVVSNTISTCRDLHSVGRSAYKNYTKEKKEEAKCLEINKSFKEGGQAGQEQAKSLSDVLKRPIHILEANGNKVILGEQYLGDPLEVTYFPPNENNPNGHYVPVGQSEDWSSHNNSPNNCLFDAIGFQIQKDPNELREKCIKQIESDPRHYIASNVRGIIINDTYLEGGRTNQPIQEKHYPSCNDRIKVAEKHVDVLAALRNTLNEHKEECEQFIRKNKRQQMLHMRCSRSVPQFGTVPDKEEMMMGSLSVRFNNGTELKLITVSGDKPFSVRQSVSDNQDLNCTKEPIPYKWENKGFKFVDSGKPQGKIFDVYHRQETKNDYTSSCAAQKLLYHLGEHMKNNPNLEIKGDINMAESWFKPGNAKFKPTQVIINKSCFRCEEALPVATGKKFDRD